MSLLFVTGTDTGVGKTFVSCALARALRARGQRVAVMKPVETGVTVAPDDALALRAAADDPASIEDICPYRFRAPLAPAVAARAEGVAIDLERIAALVRRRATSADVLLIEGAGGLCVPLTEHETFLDLAAALALPVLLVAANRLGVINHAVLTTRVARAAGLHVVGIVLSSPTRETDPSAATNAGEIERLCDPAPVVTLPHLEANAATDLMTELLRRHASAR